MTTLRQAAQQALEVLENSRSLEPVDVDWVKGKRKAVMTALRAALAEDALQRLSDIHQEMEAHDPVDYHGWVLREVLFYNGEPVSHREPEQEPVVDCPRCGHCCPQQQAEPDRRDLQAAGTHPAPCARHCEAKAFEIEIRSLKSQLKQQAEPVSLTNALDFFTETERLLLWKRGYSQANIANITQAVLNKIRTAPPQRKPLTDEQVNECGMCGYVGKDKDKTGQCPKCRWDELRPLTGKAHQKPLTDDQIYEMYNEPRSDAEMLEFARAIEAAHGIKGEA